VKYSSSRKRVVNYRLPSFLIFGGVNVNDITKKDIDELKELIGSVSTEMIHFLDSIQFIRNGVEKIERNRDNRKKKNNDIIKSVRGIGGIQNILSE